MNVDVFPHISDECAVKCALIQEDRKGESRESNLSINIRWRAADRQLPTQTWFVFRCTVTQRPRATAMRMGSDVSSYSTQQGCDVVVERDRIHL